MNYLAHLHLAQVTQTSLLGNFLGDFVKGSQLEHLPATLQLGIRLHRKVDVYTDAHTTVTSLKAEFPVETKKMAGVALDIYFDHLLVKHWQELSTFELPTLLAQFYQQLDQHNFEHSQRFKQVRMGLLKHQWLAQYAQVETCLRAFESIEQRLRGRVTFAERAFTHLLADEEKIRQSFLRFYPQLVEEAKIHAKLLQDSKTNEGLAHGGE